MNQRPLLPPLPTLIRACNSATHLEQLHSLIIRRGSEQDHFVINQFISVHTSVSSNTSYPTAVFERVAHPNIFIYNSLIKGYCSHSSLADSFSLFNRMRRECSSHVVPDKYTFAPLLQACSNALAAVEGRLIHGLIVKYGVENKGFVGSSLIDLYGKCKEIESARRVFNEMPMKNVVVWTALVFGYVNCGDFMEASHLFRKMPERNSVSWNVIISGLLRLGELNFARKWFDLMPEKDVVSFATMIDGYAKAGDMASARLLFDQAPQKDIVSWSALISGYAQNGLPGEAVKTFQEMQAMKIKPDGYIMVSIMSACSQLRSLELAEWIDRYMTGESSSFDFKSPHLAAALVDMNIKVWNMERATELFEEMPKRDVVSYCSMIKGLTLHGHGVQAVRLFDRMLSEGVTPDSVAFTVVLAACSQAGLYEEGCQYFELMVNKYSLDPSHYHYACMVDILGRSGNTEGAYELLKTMPVEPDASAWGALLGACKNHGEMELGEEVANRLFELEPHAGSNYVLLSDIYAAADRWMDVSELRSKMSEKGIRKRPGCSRI